jgi:hypothetical protein
VTWPLGNQSTFQPFEMLHMKRAKTIISHSSIKQLQRRLYIPCTHGLRVLVWRNQQYVLCQTKAMPTEMRTTLSDRMKSSIVHSVNNSNEALDWRKLLPKNSLDHRGMQSGLFVVHQNRDITSYRACRRSHASSMYHYLVRSTCAASNSHATVFTPP